MVTGSKKISFPTPGATKEKEQVVTIDAERMLIHFNQDHPDLAKPAQRITPKIVEHTSQKAKEAGWAGAAVAKDAITGHTSGMLLLRARKTTISVDAVDEHVVSAKPLSSPSE